MTFNWVCGIYSEILQLYHDSSESAKGSCLCQAITHPLTARYDWPAYGASAAVLGPTCTDGKSGVPTYCLITGPHAYG